MNTKPLLIISAIFNGILVVCLVCHEQISKAVTPTSATKIASVSARPVHDRLVTVTNQIVQKLDWRSVESEDYQRYIANLRAIGCPEETIADIIKSDVNKLFQSRRQALTDSTEGFKFWKPGNPFAMDSERLQKQQELTQEQRAILKELLGAEPQEGDVATNNPFTEILDFLSPEQQTQILEARERFKGKAMNGTGTQDERMKNMRAAEREMDRELSRIMNEREKEDYDLRLSQTAAKMREHLAAFEPSEQEFRGIFKFRKEFEDTVANLTGRPNSDVQKQSAEHRFFGQVKNFLGEPRYGDFRRALGR